MLIEIQQSNKYWSVKTYIFAIEQEQTANLTFFCVLALVLFEDQVYNFLRKFFRVSKCEALHPRGFAVTVRCGDKQANLRVFF